MDSGRFHSLGLSSSSRGDALLQFDEAVPKSTATEPDRAPGAGSFHVADDPIIDLQALDSDYDKGLALNDGAALGATPPNPFSGHAPAPFTPFSWDADAALPSVFSPSPATAFSSHGPSPETALSTGETLGSDIVPPDASTTFNLTIGDTATGFINDPLDHDWFRVTLTAGTAYNFTLNQTLGSNLDCYLRLYDANGNQVAFDDDGGPLLNSDLTFLATTSGVYYLSAEAYHDATQSSTGGYTLTSAITTPPLILDSIDWGTKLGVTTVLVYFANAGEVFDGVTSLGWNAYQQQQAMLALQQYANVANITFATTNNSSLATFKFVTNTSNAYSAYMNPPGTTNPGVAVFATNASGWGTSAGSPLDVGGLGFAVFLHEFGHGLGMAHPHDNGGTSEVMQGVTASRGSFGLFNLNQTVYTVMSYNNGWDTGPNGIIFSNYNDATTPMALDVALIQQKYGANTNYHAGDDIYSLSNPYYTCIWDGGGNDTIVYNGATACTIDLHPATIDYTATGGGLVSLVSGIHGGFTIAQGVVIENATGGSGNDTLVGNSAANHLTGGLGNDTLDGDAGNDTIDGGGGVDTAIFHGVQSAFTWVVNAGTITVTKIATGEADTLTGVEKLQFDDNIITIAGNAPTVPVDIDPATNTISEGAANGAFVAGLLPSASDPDAGDVVTFELTNDAGGRFAINPTTGQVTVANASLIDFETGGSYQISIRATDGANPSASANFTIQVTNVAPPAPADNDFSPNTIAENVSNGALVGITALSSDVHGGAVTYSLVDDAGGRFAINPITGAVTVANASLINFEDANSHQITVRANDGTANSATNSNFTINVTNLAPSAPADGNAAANTIAEGAANGTAVAGLSLSSSDPHGGTVTWSLSDDAGGRFAINASTGVVTVANAGLINFEGAASHTIQVRASDGQAFSQSNVTIDVTNVAPGAPTDSNAAGNTIAEGAANGTAVTGLALTATDPNGGTIIWSLTDDAGGRFAINPTTGAVTVANATLLNFESASSHTIQVRASDGTGFSTATPITINVVNASPSTPSDTNGAANTITEGAANGTGVAGLTLSSTDPNGPPVTWSLLDDAGGRFAINPTTGVVTIANAALINFEVASAHQIQVQASDGAAFSAAQTITIGVNNAAPSAPADGDASSNTIAEGASNGTAVAGLALSSSDPNGGTLTWSLVDDAGGRFTIDPNTGVVRVANAGLINFEGAGSHQIQVRSSDGTAFSPTSTVTINVTDVAPSAPVDNDGLTNTVTEGAVNGTAVAGLSLSASDVSGGALTWSLTDDAGGRFAINATTGVVTIANGALINFEGASSHQIQVRVSDGTLASTTPITIQVANAAPSTPTDSNGAANTVLEGAANGSAVSGITLTASDPNGGTLTWSLVDDAGGRFAINSSTGAVTVANGSLLSSSSPNQQIQVRVSDGAAFSQTASVNIAVGNVGPSTPTDSNGAANSITEGAAAGTVVAGLSLTTNDPGGGITWSLTDDAGGRFVINPTTGVVSVAAGASLNHDLAVGHSVTAQASDGQATASASFTINVADVIAGDNQTGGSGPDSFAGTFGNDTYAGAGGNDTLNGGAGLDSLSGGAGADLLTGGTGDDTIDGETGRDIAFYAIASTAAVLTHNVNGSWTVNAGTLGVDTVTNVELLRFTDRDVSLWAQSPARNDFNGDGNGDLFFVNTDGRVASWNMNGQAIVGGGDFGNPGGTWRAVGVGDLNGDGRADVLFKDAGGNLSEWLMNGAAIAASNSLGNPGAGLNPVALGDFNGDGRADILFVNGAGQYSTWDMNGSTIIGGGNLGSPGGGLVFKALGDFNGDGRSDILFQDAAGNMAAWFMNDATVAGGGAMGNPGLQWSILGAGDFNGDGFSDVLFKNTGTGMYAIWDYNGTSLIGGGDIGNPFGTWQFETIADTNGDGRSDIVFSDATGWCAVWHMNDTAIVGGGLISTAQSNWDLFA